MGYLPLSILAYLLNAVSVLINKYLLVKQSPNPFFYIFYISLFSLIVLLGIPFVSVPSLKTFTYASISTLLWTSGAYFMFNALKIGSPTRVIPVIGTLIPVTLAGIGYISGTLTSNELLAITVLVMGLFFLVMPYLKGRINQTEILSILVSSLFFADSYVILSWAYQMGDFASVFVYSRIILIPFLLAFYFIPGLKKKFLNQKHSNTEFKFLSKGGILFLASQLAGGASELLLTFSISLANPAVVNSLQGVQYVFLFIVGLILARRLPHLFGEKLSPLLWIGKLVGIILITLGLFILSMSEAASKNEPKIGVTYSPRYAIELGLDPEESYQRLLSNIDVKYIRLPLYWSEFEDDKDQFKTDALKFYLDEAQKNNSQVIIALGYKSPRWPECYPPDWARNLSREQLQERILIMLHEAIILYKDHPAVSSWQIENEPFLAFGDCPAQNPLTFEFVKKEVALAKSLDNKPVLVTDSGEISSWTQALQLSNFFGTTMYRQVWNPYIGWFDYPLPAFFYTAKNWLVQKVVGVSNVKTIVSELQAEPWVPSQKSLIDWDIDQQFKIFPPKKIETHLEFAKSTGFPEIYLWGAEWWLWMEKNGYPEYLETAESVFAKSK